MGNRENAEGIAAMALDAYQLGTTGDFTASDRCLAVLGNIDNTAATAWSLALRAQRWHAQPDAPTPVDRTKLAALAKEDTATRTGAVIACAEGAKLAIITHQVRALRAWTELQQQLAAECIDPWALSAAKIQRAWMELSNGNAEAADALAEEVRTLAGSSGVAPAVIEATALRAVCAEAIGDPGESRSFARRAWRMARTEDLPQYQYLASLVLARARRLDGFPHLTMRILKPLSEVAPRHWHGWIAWEALAAGAVRLANELELDDTNDPQRLVRSLRRVLASALAAQPEEFTGALRSARSLEAGWILQKQDLDIALAAMDAGHAPAEANDDLEAWRRGDVNTPPNAISGLCIDLESDPSDPGPAAFVVADKLGGRRAARVAGLAERVANVDAQIRRMRGKAERNPTVLAAIALAGPTGLSREDLFLVVYGFPYHHEVHRSLFKALMHRVRRFLGENGTLEMTEDDRYVLRLDRTLLIPDPRCDQSLEDVVLRALARGGRQGARFAADEVGIPLRTAQAALKRLVEAGIVVSEKAGKRLIYEIEDTTFSEPTKWS